ncbi:DUF2244 domain-containing protein [Aeoliella mucimassa]|uniref:SHOCT domain-containing protein n=1 Tax=Aeoliella mucimassa TaxID=2527972 RepID=A0A518ANG6_9BACT|nr:DUF2244 domain-containing protein [Aeoliella mucimassa]QDU56264.1 hypothetical protein Pan181_24720 [Aeoliella mucimassa]
MDDDGRFAHNIGWLPFPQADRPPLGANTAERRDLKVLGIVALTWTKNAFGLATATLWFALIFALLTVAVILFRRYRKHGSLLGKLRDNSSTDEDDPSALLTKFRDLHSRGTLSDGEYRTIKAKLATQLHSELGNDSDPNKS